MNDRALLVEDDSRALRDLEEALAPYSLDLTRADSMAKAQEALAESPFDLALVDLVLPDGDGIELVRQIKARRAATEIVVLTGFSSVDSAVAAMTAGARTYLQKPFALAELRAVIEKSLEVVALRRAAERRAEGEGVDRILGISPSIRRLREEILAVAPAEVPVLLQGESGTGKELVARALHHHSGRLGVFLAVNAAALSSQIIESELFGHVRGAFTSALRDHKGCFERASRGTLFLDEIGDLPLELQPKLLRVLESGGVLPVGGERSHPIDARFVAASNLDLSDAIARGQFRADLFHRISVAILTLPPLRERRDDIPFLAEIFLGEAAQRRGRDTLRFAHGALDRICAHEFPGNVRELRNLVERLALFAEGEAIEVRDVDRRIEPSPLPPTDSNRIREALASVGGNRKRAAERLGMSERTLYRHIRREGLS